MAFQVSPVFLHRIEEILVRFASRDPGRDIGGVTHRVVHLEGFVSFIEGRLRGGVFREEALCYSAFCWHRF